MPLAAVAQDGGCTALLVVAPGRGRSGGTHESSLQPQRSDDVIKVKARAHGLQTGDRNVFPALSFLSR